MNDLDITQAVSRVLSKYTKTTAPAPEQPAPAATTPLDRGSIDAIVASVLASQTATAVDGSAGDGVFATMDAAIAAAQQAYIQYRHCSMQDRARFVEGIRQFSCRKKFCTRSRPWRWKRPGWETMPIRW